jgi:hypothetical protein
VADPGRGGGARRMSATALRIVATLAFALIIS